MGTSTYKERASIITKYLIKLKNKHNIENSYVKYEQLRITYCLKDNLAKKVLTLQLYNKDVFWVDYCFKTWGENKTNERGMLKNMCELGNICKKFIDYEN
jgi:hypothetical protein